MKYKLDIDGPSFSVIPLTYPHITSTNSTGCIKLIYIQLINAHTVHPDLSTPFSDPIFSEPLLCIVLTWLDKLAVALTRITKFYSK